MLKFSFFSLLFRTLLGYVFKNEPLKAGFWDAWCAPFVRFFTGKRTRVTRLNLTRPDQNLDGGDGFWFRDSSDSGTGLEPKPSPSSRFWSVWCRRWAISLTTGPGCPRSGGTGQGTWNSSGSGGLLANFLTSDVSV